MYITSLQYILYSACIHTGIHTHVCWEVNVSPWVYKSSQHFRPLGVWIFQCLDHIHTASLRGWMGNINNSIHSTYVYVHVQLLMHGCDMYNHYTYWEPRQTLACLSTRPIDRPSPIHCDPPPQQVDPSSHSPFLYCLLQWNHLHLDVQGGQGPAMRYVLQQWHICTTHSLVQG